MQIQKNQINILLEQLIRSRLEDGIIPSSEEIITYINNFTDLNKPLSTKDLNFISEYSNEKSSASKYNENTRKFQYDLDVLYKAIFGITKDSFLNIERWKEKYNILYDRIRSIENRVNGHLLVARRTAGFFYFTDETFANASNIDISNTTARLDFNQKFVGLGDLTTNTKFNLNGIQNKDITFNVINSPAIASSSPMSDTEPRFIFTDVDQYWGHIIQTNNIGPVIISITSKIFAQPTEISSLDLTLFTSNLSRGVITQIQYSTDNITWQDLPINNPTPSVENNISFIFNPVDVVYLKIFLTKNIPDLSGKFHTYQFGIRNLSVGNIGFNTNTTSVLVTKPIQILDSNDRPIPLHQISLDVCESIPDKTFINYYISTDVDIIEEDRKYTSIEPSTRNTSLQSKVLNLVSNNIVSYNNITLATADESKNLFQQRTACDYVIKANNGNLELPDNLIDKTEIIWRNVGTKNNNILINNMYRGWTYEEPYYRTVINIASENGITIDFGSTFIDIDGILQNNTVKLTTGIHVIKIHKRSFYDIFSGSNPSSDWVVIQENIDSKTITFENDEGQTFQLSDPLYPYNHKLLIEGLTYSNTYTSKKTYNGVSLYAAYKMRRVSLTRFINCDNVDNSEYAIDYSLVNRKPMFITKVDASVPSSEFTKELFIVQYTLKTSTNTVKDIILKAILHTDDINQEPRLTAFRIKGL